MELRKTPALTENMRIRKRLLGLIFKAGSESLRIASSRELAKQFGVAHMTVARVIKDLADEGFLVIKPGIGTFTKVQNDCVFKDSKLFGIVLGDGKYVFFDRLEAKLFSVFMDALLRFSRSNWVQNYSILSKLEASAKELGEAGLEGVVWILPPLRAVPVIKALHQRGMPVFSVGRKVDGVGSCQIDYAHDNCLIARKMLEAGRRRILLLVSKRPDFMQEGAVAGFEKAFAGFGLPFDKSWVVYCDADEHEAFGGILDERRPDAILFNDGIRPFWDTLKKRPEVLSSCLFFSEEWDLRNDIAYEGWVGLRDLQGVAGKVAELMSQGSTLDSVDLAMPLEIRNAKDWRPV